jgi:hypothetical protein
MTNPELFRGFPGTVIGGGIYAALTIIVYKRKHTQEYKSE